MKKVVIRMSLLAALLTSDIVTASSYIKYGFSASAANLSVVDPDGETESTNVTYLDGFMIVPFSKNHPSIRYKYKLKYRAFDLEPSTVNVGQSVESLSLSVNIQKGWRSETLDAYWIGIGASLNLDDYSKRLTVDSGGFVDTRFADRSETILGIDFSLGFNFPKTSAGYTFGMEGVYHTPIDDGIEGVSVSLFVLW